ncbi:MAG: glycosyltransferase [Actinobacteria bacterium]|nr:glycosyltransferase [Actinomycetota bacterium]
MRVAFITPEYPPAERMGGIGTNTATVAPALARAGHEVVVVARGEGPERTTRDGVEIVRVRPRAIPLSTASRILARRQIGHAALRFRPDVIQAPEYEAEGWWVARRSGVPLVTRLATPTYLIERLNGRPRDPRRDLLRRLERDQTVRSAAVFAPSRALADLVSRDWGLPPGSVSVIPSPVDARAIEAAMIAEPSVALPRRFLCFLGRLERRKGVEPLAMALPVVLGAHPDVHAVLIGRDPGEDGGALTELLRRAVEPVAERVYTLGELPREQALAVAARAELVVLPSLWENLANACLEAMALGRPVVATDVGGFPEVLTDGREGWLVPPGDADALAAVMTERLGDPAGLEKAGRAGRERARGFSVEAVVEELGALYEEVAAGRGRPFGAGIYRRGYTRHFRADDRRDPFHTLYAAKRDAVLTHFAGLPRTEILDVGGGYGRLAGPLAESHDVTLCDVSPEMVQEARRRWPGLRALECDAAALPFEDGAYDAALALDLTPHAADLDRVLSELARVVRPGGEVILDSTNAAALWVLAFPAYVDWRPRRLLRTLRAGGVLPEWARLVRHHRAGDMRRALECAGLQVRRMQPFGPRWSAKWHLWWTVKL